ncbi:hypothetical protein ACGRPS_02915 [Vibrio furnissii]
MLQILIYRLVLALLTLNQRQQHQLCQRKFHHWLTPAIICPRICSMI